ncbi:MAG: hypothetical protein ACFFDN_33120 [Candidatus Hodarchaeota archaeon]
MNRDKMFLPLIALLIASILLSLPVQPVQAIGPILEEGADGFNFAENDTWTMEYTITTAAFAAGDKVKYTITATNNSIDDGSVATPPGWIADMIWAKAQYYAVNGTYKEFPEMLIGAYNSTDPFTTYNLSGMFYYSGQYNFWTFAGGGPIIPQNFTAANHTIVNITYSNLYILGSFSFTTPTPPNIAGTWEMTAGNIATFASIKEQWSYNSKGICIRHRIYMVISPGSWTLVTEERLVEEEKGIPIELLALAMMAGGGGGIGTIEILIIAGIAGAIVVIIIIAAVAKSKG